MICSTHELTRYVRDKYVANGRQIEGVDFLEEALFADSEYRRFLTHLKARLNRHRREEILYITDDRTALNRSIWNLIELLDFIDRQEGPEILVRGIPEVKQNIKSLKPGRTKNKLLTNSAKRNRTSAFSSINFFLKNTMGKLEVAIVAILSFVFISYLAVNLLSASDEGNDPRSFSSFEKITTTDFSQDGQWVIWRTSFETYDDARADKSSTATHHPDVQILKLSDSRFHLVEFAGSRDQADRLNSTRSRRHKLWRNSKIGLIDAKKCELSFKPEVGCYVCK